MNILVKKNNQTFGPHSREEIIEFIENGELSPDDLGTLESEENWVPLNNFISSQNTDSESIYDQFEDEDIDYEKLKEWEDVFKDDEDEGDLTEEEVGNTTPHETGSVSSSEQSIYSEANLTDEQGGSYASAPPPLQESEMQTPTAPSDILLPRENEISPNELPDHEELIIKSNITEAIVKIVEYATYSYNMHIADKIEDQIYNVIQEPIDPLQFASNIYKDISEKIKTSKI